MHRGDTAEISTSRQKFRNNWNGPLFRFSGGDRDDLGAEVEAHGGHVAHHYRPYAFGHEATVRKECGHDVGLMRPRGPQTEQVQRTEEHEHDDRADLDRGEPELELAVAADRNQIGRGKYDEQHEADDRGWNE